MWCVSMSLLNKMFHNACCVPIISPVMIGIKSLTFYVTTQILTLLVNSDTQAYRIKMYIGLWQYCELRRTSMTFTGRFKNNEKLRPWPLSCAVGLTQYRRQPRACHISEQALHGLGYILLRPISKCLKVCTCRDWNLKHIYAYQWNL